ncbi:MAG: DUF202 domain-containing protein [Dermatophilaceae bacterium]
MTGLSSRSSGPEPGAGVGLQAERTSIAWQRTALTLTAFSVLILHAADRQRLGQIPGALGIAAALWLLFAAERRYSSSRQLVRDGRSPVAPRMIRALALAVVGLAAAAFVLLVLTSR